MLKWSIKKLCCPFELFFVNFMLCCESALNLIVCVNAGVDLSCIVKAVPTLSSADSQEEQTHEVLQVSLDLFSWKENAYSKVLSILKMFFLIISGFGVPPNWKRLCWCDSWPKKLHWAVLTGIRPAVPRCPERRLPRHPVLLQKEHGGAGSSISCAVCSGRADGWTARLAGCRGPAVPIGCP